MSSRRRKKKKQGQFAWMKYAAILGILLFFAVALSIYFMPFVAYYRIESAIVTKDGDRFSAYTDVNELRRSLKMQKGQRVIKKLKKDNLLDRSLTDVAIEWSALTRDGDIDEAISPEGFFFAVWGGSKRGIDPIKAPPPEKIDTYEMVQKLIADASFRYSSTSKFVVRVKDHKGRYIQYLSFEFSRTGIDWKLTKVSLPPY